MRLIFGVMVLIAATGLSACAKKGLRELDARRNSPDEFLVLPSKPLEAPTSYSSLPEPTPGGTNLTDRNPNAEAVAALGGRLAPADGVPSSDAALVTAASRHGVAPDIRPELAEADAKLRKRGAFLANIKLFRIDRYAEVYERQSLEPGKVAGAYRKAGIPVPSAPPTGN
jgi:hypothetical protein